MAIFNAERGPGYIVVAGAGQIPMRSTRLATQRNDTFSITGVPVDAVVKFGGVRPEVNTIARLSLTKRVATAMLSGPISRHLCPNRGEDTKVHKLSGSHERIGNSGREQVCCHYYPAHVP